MGESEWFFIKRRPLHANVFTLKPYQDKTHRLVIDLVDVAAGEKRNRGEAKAKRDQAKGDEDRRR